MPRKQQGWITFQSSESEQQFLEQYCQKSQRTKTEVLRELVRSLNPLPQWGMQEDSNPTKVELLSYAKAKAMKLSARNTFKGTIKQVVTGAVNSEVTIEIAPGVEVTSIITKASAENLGLAEGKVAYAVIKSSDVMIAVDWAGTGDRRPKSLSPH